MPFNDIEHGSKLGMLTRTHPLVSHRFGVGGHRPRVPDALHPKLVGFQGSARDRVRADRYAVAGCQDIQDRAADADVGLNPHDNAGALCEPAQPFHHALIRAGRELRLGEDIVRAQQSADRLFGSSQPLRRLLRRDDRHAQLAGDFDQESCPAHHPVSFVDVVQERGLEVDDDQNVRVRVATHRHAPRILVSQSRTSCDISLSSLSPVLILTSLPGTNSPPTSPTGPRTTRPAPATSAGWSVRLPLKLCPSLRGGSGNCLSRLPITALRASRIEAFLPNFPRPLTDAISASSRAPAGMITFPSTTTSLSTCIMTVSPAFAVFEF